MAHRFVKVSPEMGYAHFWFTNSKTGRRINFTISDGNIDKAIQNKESFCEVLEDIINCLEEEGYYDQG